MSQNKSSSYIKLHVKWREPFYRIQGLQITFSAINSGGETSLTQARREEIIQHKTKRNKRKALISYNRKEGISEWERRKKGGRKG